MESEEPSTSDVDINTVPNEILTKILSYLGGSWLLPCRKVCHLWNLIATSLCRTNHVPLVCPLTNRYFCVNQHGLFDTFPSPENLPWSALRISGWGLPGQPNTATVLRLISKFYGTQVLKLQIEGMQNFGIKFLFDILTSLSNLLELSTDNCPRGAIPPTHAVRLPNLKHFTCELSNLEDIKFLEFIVSKSGAIQLECGYFRLKLGHHEANTSKAVVLMSRFQQLHLTYDYYPCESMKFLTNLPLRTLKLCLFVYHHTPPNYYETLERFLDTNGKQLVKLELQYELYDGALGTFLPKIQIPSLPELKFFKIFRKVDTEYFQVEAFGIGKKSMDEEDMKLEFRSKFTATLFPAIQKIILKI